tara:strand:- start:2865 stop:4166 length:1302 start_codon:yes stop_codon:yes gene_type:complete
VNKLFHIFLLLVLVSSCSLNKNSKFWTKAEKIYIEENENYFKILKKEKTLDKELNSNIKIKLNSKIKKKAENKSYTNNQRFYFDGNLNRSSKFSFSKIKNFNQYDPEILFSKDNVIFFDNKGSIFKFDKKSKLIWKKNYYTKSEKKLGPILQMQNNGNYLIIIDNLAKYYALNIETGDLIWSKNNLAPFNSQIKIYKNNFFVIDFTNTLRCFSISNGKELWNVKTENTLVRSPQKLSMVIVDDKVYFNNSIGDISAVDIKRGELLWQLPTQSTLILESSFSLKTSDIITDNKSLFFSNNKNQIFSVDIKSGNFNWENKINSNLKSTLVGNYLFSISIEGYLIITDKETGNIIRITDIFRGFNDKERSKVKPIGFILGTSKIYLSTSNGRLIIIDISSGKSISKLKIDNEKISKPFVQNQNLFLIKDNAIIKLN